MWVGDSDGGAGRGVKAAAARTGKKQSRPTDQVSKMNDWMEQEQQNKLL